jgi:hypothetical protein
LTGGDPVDLQQDETANGLIHVSALSLTKVADSLIDPKLVPTWLLSALGARGSSSVRWCRYQRQDPCCRN